jgi:hypothetical protein
VQIRRNRPDAVQRPRLVDQLRADARVARVATACPRALVFTSDLLETEKAVGNALRDPVEADRGGNNALAKVA